MAAAEVIPANNILFSDFCNVLEKLHKQKPHRQEQDKVLAKFINDFRINVANVPGKKNSSFFPILRLLLPEKERERPAYNMKDKTLGEFLRKVLSLSKDSADGKSLMNYRTVQNSADSDFAGVVYFIMKKRDGKKTGSLTIGNVNELLDKIANAEVGNKGPVRDEAFSHAIKHLSALEFKWFLRIILKDLKLGLGVHRTLAAFHSDAPELFDSCGNLSKVCEELEDGETRPSELGIRLFYAVSPMLSERLDVTRCNQLPAGRKYQVEAKFDGERFQMHMENKTFEYFSRKGFTYSDSYGKTFDSGLLTPFLKDCFSPSVHSVILDGEMMGWHKQRQCYGSKGMAFDVKKITENSRFRPCFCVFDVLYYNGTSLVGPPEKGGLPLSKRLNILATLFTEVQGVIMRSKYTIINDKEEILDALNKAIEDQEEGIVVKDTESYYIANKRNAGWYKIKPEYTESTMSDLDLVIIGAEQGDSRRQGRARSFHVACADRVNPAERPHRWLDVGKVATGLTFDEHERVCALLDKRWVPYKRAPPPPELVFNREKPDYWIKPDHSIVLQVRATELIRSTDFGTEYTLRFPRVARVRDDKPVDDVMTLAEFNKLVEEKTSVVKLSTKRVSLDQLDELPVKARRKREAKVIKVADQFRTKPIEGVEVTSQALAGREVCVVSDDVECSKQELVRLVESHGGRHVENAGPDTWCCVVGRLTVRARNCISARRHDVVSAAWLRALPPAATPCALHPLDMLAVKDDTRLKLSRHYDKYGDSYTEPIDEDTLRRCFKKMEVEEPEIYLTNSEMLNLDKELFGDHNPFSYLRPCYIHFNNKNARLKIKAQFFGANVCIIDSPNLTHVVVSKDTNVEAIKESLIESEAVVVSEEWLETCFSDGKLVPYNDFVME